MSTLITLRGVSRIHESEAQNVTALDNVDFDLSAGEMVAVIGRSGSGKSTLLNICGAIDAASAGRVEIAGRPMHGASVGERAAVRRRHVGVVFQQLNLIPSLTAAENVALPLELDGCSAADARTLADEALGRVGLVDRTTHFPDALSGGERQRVAIARALIGSRSILLADEPTGALDERSGDQILDLLRAQADAGLGVVLVTHDRALAGMADRIIELRDGRVSSIVERSDVDLELSGLWR